MGWSGNAASGEGWFAFRGDTADNSKHVHAAVQVVVGSQSPVAITTPEGRVQGRALMIRSGVWHALEPATDLLLVLLEPDAPEAVFLSDAAPEGAVVSLPNRLASLIDASVECDRCLDRLSAAASGWPTPSIDPRLKIALDALRSPEGSQPIARAAARAGISPARLRALATRDLRRPLTEWVAWRKAERAVAAIRDGATLAAAAADAGFADQAHMAHAIRRLLGITPGTVDAVLHDRAGQAKTTIRKAVNAL